MDPETYQASTKEGFAHATRLVQQLGTVAVVAFLVALIAWGCWRFGPELVGLVNRCVVWGAELAQRLAETIRAFARQPVVRRVSITGVAFGSLVLGVVAGVFQLDERWRTRNRRFWCLTPDEAESWLQTGRVSRSDEELRSDAERIRIINDLSAFGNQARRAIPVLTGYLNHPSASVSLAARVALARIEATHASESSRYE